MATGTRKKATQENLNLLKDNKSSCSFIGESFASDFSQNRKIQQIIQASVDQPSRSITSNKQKQKYSLYENIENMPSPYNFNNSSHSDGQFIDIKEIVELCQKAYINVPIFRNTIDVLTEFSNTKVYFEGGTKKSRDFFDYWFNNKISGWDLTGQWLREWYRSGNVILYRFDGDVSIEGLKDITKVYGADEKIDLDKIYKLPTKYLVVNPADVKSQGALNFFDNTYYKTLTAYEVACLKNPKTEQVQDFFDNLDPDIQKRIKGGEVVLIPLDPTKTYCFFQKKQDYEPFAIPLFYAVLPDIDLKLGFKKIEKIITRTVEYVILHVKVGTEELPNPEGINAINELFSNETIGRLLVTDGTTEMKFIIPDVNKVLGKDKYQQVNEDIADGLQNIFFGDEKFSSTSIKINVFMERLKDAQTAYLTYFLNPEIKRIAKELGFKSYPTAKMTHINLQDKVNLTRVYTRLMELSVLTPAEGLEAIQTGILPDPVQSLENQKEYTRQKEQGLYVPLTSNAPPIDEESNVTPTPKGQPGKGRPPGSGGNKLSGPRQESPVGISKSSFAYDLDKIKDLIIKTSSVESLAAKELRKKHSIKKLTQEQESVAKQICKLVYANEKPEEWEGKIEEYINSPKPISESIADEIDEIRESHNDCSTFLATMLWHSKVSQ